MSEKYPLYEECTENFHAMALEKGYAKSGVISVKELDDIRDLVCVKLFNDNGLRRAYRDDPSKVYYIAIGHIFQAGMVLADVYHNAPDKIRKGSFARKLIKEGPWSYAEPLIKNKFGWDADKFGAFFDVVYQDSVRLIQPFMLMPNPSEYIVDQIRAFYQLGVSMILDTYNKETDKKGE